MGPEILKVNQNRAGSCPDASIILKGKHTHCGLCSLEVVGKHPSAASENFPGAATYSKYASRMKILSRQFFSPGHFATPSGNLGIPAGSSVCLVMLKRQKSAPPPAMQPAESF